MTPESFQSGPSGGKGGNAFTDDIPAAGVKVQAVFIEHGDWVNALQFFYTDGSSTDLHGKTSGGSPTTLLFKPDETLLEVYGSYGDYINSVTLRTNVQTYGPFGKVGGGDDKTYRYQALDEGTEVIGLFGACGEYLDSFGVIRRRNRANGAARSA